LPDGNDTSVRHAGELFISHGSEQSIFFSGPPPEGRLVGADMFISALLQDATFRPPKSLCDFGVWRSTQQLFLLGSPVCASRVKSRDSQCQAPMNHSIQCSPQQFGRLLVWLCSQ
jgi:hypothetical protein